MRKGLSKNRLQGYSSGMRLFLAVVGGLAFAGALQVSGVLSGADGFFYDLGARAGARLEEPREKGSDGSSGVRLIYVDQYSLEWAEKNLGVVWPWPRELYARIADFCSGARVQVFDILFTEASSYGVWDDERLAEGFARAGNVVVATTAGTGVAPGPGGEAKRSSGATAVGDARGYPDADGILRRYGQPPGETSVPTLGDAALSEGGVAGGGQSGLPRDPELRHLRFYGKSPSFPAWNAAEILAASLGISPENERETVREQLRDSYVFVGFSAPGLLDRQATPTDPAMPGAEIHATYVWNILTGRLPRDLPATAVWILAAAAAIAASFAASRLGKAAHLVIVFCLFALVPPLAAIAAYLAGWVFPPSASLAAGLGSFSIGFVFAYVTEGRNRVFLRRSFGRYLAPSVVDELVKNPDLLQLGGTEKEITVFFSDIQGFTALSESISPSTLAIFMNEYLSVISSVILEEGGTIDKYVGDAVVAFWNAPLDQIDHARRAISAAMGCSRAFALAKDRFDALGVSIPITRIGIHSGKAIVGNMGSPERFNYTALGDVVNTASRLEEANKVLGTSILVSSATAARFLGREPGSPVVESGNISLKRLGFIAVPGRKASIEVWEPADAEGKFSSRQPWDGCLDCST